MNNSARPVVVQFLAFRPQYKRGMEVFFLELADALRQRGWQVVFVFSGEPVNWFHERLRDWGIPYCVTRSPLSVQDCWRAFRFLSQFQPRLLQTFYISSFSVHVHLLRLGLRARNLIVSDHSSGLPSAKNAMRKALAWLRGKTVGIMIDRVVTLSDFQTERDVTGAYLPRRKFRKVYSGVDLDRYVPQPHLKSKESIIISYAGQLRSEKGVLTLLRAFCEVLREKNWAMELRIAGCGDQLEELRRFCKDNGLTEVTFLGGIDFVPDLFASSDIVVVPSEWAEAFGLVVVEAMACGTALVCSDAGGIPEVLGASGEAGLIFRHGDVQDLKNKLAVLIESADLRQEMARKGRDRAVQFFSKEKMVDGYVAVLEEIARK